VNQQELLDFTERYFNTLGCETLTKHPAYLEAQLTVEVDKEIMNRPYYWMFVEKTGAPPQPQRVTFIFDEAQLPDGVQGEWIKFGCWRLHLIFDSAKRKGRFIRLYEVVEETDRTQGLFPWLMLNYKISFISDQKKDLFYPLGMNLLTGQILTQFEDILQHYRLTPKIPDYHFTLRPIYSLPSALQCVEEHIQSFLAEQDTSWAIEANRRLDEESKLLDTFYGKTAKQERKTYQKRMEEIEYYRPKIEVSPINVGLVYLQTHPQSKMADIKPPFGEMNGN
jgi:hypothetical protein